MGLKDKITQIAFETASQVVASVVGGLSNNYSTTANITAISTDSSGNTTCTATLSNGTIVTGIYLSTNRPLGVGSTINLVGANGSYIGQ